MPDTEVQEQETIQDKLKRARELGDAPLLPTPSIWNPKYSLLKYQRVGAAHLAVNKRFILGDATGSGKTVQELFSWALIRDMRIKQGKVARLWVVAKKAATKQWQDECHKFLLDLNVYRVPSETSADKRLLIYKEWITDNTGAVIICNWAQFVADWEPFKKQSQPQIWFPQTTIVLDECLFRTQRIRIQGGKTATIYEVVNNPAITHVESWSFENKCWEQKRILRKLKNPRRGRKIVRIYPMLYSEEIGSIVCSDNHSLLRKDGTKVAAGDIKPGDLIAVKALDLTSQQEQIVLGSLLGDATLSRENKGWRFNYKQSEEQKAYFEWKHKYLSSLGTNISPRREENGGWGDFIWCKSTNDLVAFTEYARFVYGSIGFSRGRSSGMVRIVSEEWLSKIDVRGLAVWFCDDGSSSFAVYKSSRKLPGKLAYAEKGLVHCTAVQFATYSFSLESCQILVAWLKSKWGIEAKIRQDNRGKGPYLALKMESANILIGLVKDYVPESMKYKVNGMGENKWGDVEEPVYGLKEVVVEKVREIKGYDCFDKDNWLFNIEVEDNHNFCAQGILTSNCHKIKNPESKLGKTAREILLEVDRAHGLTATLVHNKAHDAQAVVEAIAPGTIGLVEFETKYCLKAVRRVKPPGYRRSIKIMETVGYHDLDKFREQIAPVYLGRSDDEIEAQRPEVTFMKRTVRMSDSQRRIYMEAEQGFLLSVETENAAAALGHAQQACCCPEHFDSLNPYPFSVRTKDNAKAQLLEEILEEEIPGEPVVIYTPLETIISAYEKRLAKFNPVRVTGKENEIEREKAKEDFMSGKTKVMLITNAGGESLNLQVGRHLFFLTRPWDPGTYTQVIGRIRRFGSTHKCITAWHLDCDDSIDEYADSVLNEKFGPVEEIVNGRGKMLPGEYVLPKEIAIAARRRRLREKLK